MNLQADPICTIAKSGMSLLAQANNPPWWSLLLMFVAFLILALTIRNSDAGTFERLLRNDLRARFVGLFLAAVGLGAGYLLIYEPLYDALAQRSQIKVRFGIVAFTTITALFGLVLLLAGRNAPKFVITRRGQSYTRLQTNVIILAVVGALAAEVGYHYFLRTMGYSSFFR